jgi:C1A family cysteine protease
MAARLKKRDNRWYGLVPDLPDHRDRIFKPAAVPPDTPVDLRQWCAPVMDQGELGSCTAHGITGALRFALLKAGKADIPMSRLQLYYDERSIEGTTRSDAGAMIRDGIKAAAKKGVAHESLWPYDVKKFTKKPPQTVYKDAKEVEALVYERVSVSVNDLKAAIASGYPVVIGISVYESFESAGTAKTGMIPMPGKKEQLLGGHCMLVVGYGQKPDTFTVRNSWAANWGDKGDCYLPEGYLGSTKYGSDYWLVRQVGKSA